MNFAVGSAIRFTARFVSRDQPKDPREVTAVVTLDGIERKFSMGSGGLARHSEGVYSIDVVLEHVGELVVRFNGDTGFGESTYEVGERGAVVTAPMQNGAIIDEDDVARIENDEATRLEEYMRESRRDELRDAGIDVDGRSDDFVDAAWRQMQKTKPATPRDSHAESMRNAWRGR